MKKILYFCAFVPYMTIQNMGFDMITVYDQDPAFRSDLCLRGNFCSFIKYCGAIDFTKYDGVIFTNCCNSTQRLYDFVKYQYPKLFTFLLELSHADSDIYNFDDLTYALRNSFNVYRTNLSREANIKEDPPSDILVIASALRKRYIDNLAGIFSNYRLQFETCQSNPKGDYVINNIKNVSCPRMLNFVEYIKSLIINVKAVIYVITHKCDQIMFSYPTIKKLCDSLGKKSLVVEEEFIDQLTQRSKIRYEAFQESLYLKKI